MKNSLSILVALLIVNTALGQSIPGSSPPEVPQPATIPMEKIEVVPKKLPDLYSAAVFRSDKERIPLVIFNNVAKREIAGMVSTVFDNPKEGSFIGYSKPGSREFFRLPATATDRQINDAIEGVSQMATPFDKSDRYANNRNRADDNGPWSSVEEQKKIRDMWPDEGVPVDWEHLKFYKLRPASQAVAAFSPGDGRIRRFIPVEMDPTNANRDFPWVGSGGMDFAKKGTWRNATGMMIPKDAKIKTWTAPMLVSTQYEIALHWEFPTGTQMFDVLIRKNDDGSEHIFNIRRRIKEASGWDDGASFFPDLELGEVQTFVTNGSERSRKVLGVPKITYRFATVDPVAGGKSKFKESSVAMNDDGHFFPPGFKGTGMSCNKCHNGGAHESKAYGGPLLRGKDTVFSWYPIDPSLVIEGEAFEARLYDRLNLPTLDRRWPIYHDGHSLAAWRP